MAFWLRRQLNYDAKSFVSIHLSNQIPICLLKTIYIINWDITKLLNEFCKKSNRTFYVVATVLFIPDGYLNK